MNLFIPDQTVATYFYANVLGLTRDPYIEWGPGNMWINAGKQQFHLPTGKAQILRGHVGVSVPDLSSLEKRLRKTNSPLQNTCFNFSIRKNHISVTCPWGNRLKCLERGTINSMQLGIPYVEFEVPEKSTSGIGLFYDKVMGCRVKRTLKSCKVFIGKDQFLNFKEVKNFNPNYDGHHIAIYVANFSGPHKFLKSNNLITDETDQNQYRFTKIIDPKTKRFLFEIEHEVRSLYHPMHERSLINRNPDQNFFNYQRGRDAFFPAETDVK
ncbi:MAG: hypothetical protein CMQ40_00565 [Gammaproteobacteria bacterium]|nr:hypothetical protein [Gammaproteobacteria bacterium]